MLEISNVLVPHLLQRWPTLPILLVSFPRFCDIDMISISFKFFMPLGKSVTACLLDLNGCSVAGCSAFPDWEEPWAQQSVVWKWLPFGSRGNEVCLDWTPGSIFFESLNIFIVYLKYHSSFWSQFKFNAKNSFDSNHSHFHVKNFHPDINFSCPPQAALPHSPDTQTLSGRFKSRLFQ